MSRAAVVAAIAACVGCAHSSPPAAPPSPAAVTVYLSENGHPAMDGPIGLYEICADTGGHVQSIKVVQSLPSHPFDLDVLRSQKPSPGMLGRCTPVRVYCDDCNAKAAAATSTPPEAATASTDDAPAVTTTKFKNVSPWDFELAILESPIPRLPDAVKMHHVGERLVFAAKLCAGSDGRVASVSLMQGIPEADDAIIGTIRRWRVRPQPPGQGLCAISRLVYDVVPNRSVRR